MSMLYKPKQQLGSCLKKNRTLNYFLIHTIKIELNQLQ